MIQTRKNWFITLIVAIAFTSGCGSKSSDYSQPLVTDVEHSTVKRQSIGNCWLYATSSWTESLHLKATDETVNVSESYWTWWHWYNQILNPENWHIDEISTGGWWTTAINIINSHGIVMEGDFISGDEDNEMSYRQSSALSTINYELKEGGKLAEWEQRTPENVRMVLDEAFGTDMAEAETIAISSREFKAQDTRGHETNLRSLTYTWHDIDYYRGSTSVLRRVMKALNDKQPVIISTMIDFNALDIKDTMFKLETLEEAGEMGDQGGHMMALEDYVVDNVPGVGSIEEGDVSDRLKKKALRGDLRYLVAKNSWGTNRPGRGLTDGYSRFHIDYLNATLPWKRDNDDPESVYYQTTLSGFIIPPGY